MLWAANRHTQTDVDNDARAKVAPKPRSSHSSMWAIIDTVEAVETVFKVKLDAHAIEELTHTFCAS
jgi:hypothetical protein